MSFQTHNNNKFNVILRTTQKEYDIHKIYRLSLSEIQSRKHTKITQQTDDDMGLGGINWDYDISSSVDQENSLLETNSVQD